MNTAKQEIVNTILKMARSYTPYNIFSDWIKICAISIQNGLYPMHNETWNYRERQYMETIEKYNIEEQKSMTNMFGMLVEAFEDEVSDILGEIYMESGCGSKATGQFFTPFHISCLTAAVGIPRDINEENKFIIIEPSSGGGGMIIAAAKVIKGRGLDYQKCMEVTAKDLDWNGVYMTYVQLSILGISATVIHTDVISKTAPGEKDIFYTPKRIGVLL